MKLRNKKTGEIGYLQNDTLVKKLRVVNANNDTVGEYNSLAEFNSEWEDYEEPKEYWYIYADKPQRADCGDILEEDFKSIGNYFATKEEAEKAVEKLKAWKRLKERHFKFDDYDILNQTATWLVSREYDQYENDIKLLFRS